MYIKNLTRGKYNEIVFSQISKCLQKQVLNLVDAASRASKVDEHGSWEFGKAFDFKGRGSALNWDLYAFGKDYHTKRMLIIIQIRKYQKAKRNYYPSIRKNYYMIGRNEDNTVFAHSVESRVIHYAINNDKNVILAVQNWIFGFDYTKVLRQGDIALVPVRKPKGELLPTTELLLENSHKVVANEIFQNGIYYVKNPVMIHLPNTHPQISGIGWFKISVGTRASYWKFAAPTVD